MTKDKAPAPFDQGVADLAEYFRSGDPRALSDATSSFRRATALGSGSADAWAALGFSLDAAGDCAGAIAALRTAIQLDPERREAEVLTLTLLAECGAESEAMHAIEAAAARQGVDLMGLRRDLEEAGLRVDAQTLAVNAFVHGRNHLRSWLEDEIDRVAERRSPSATGAARRAEERLCFEMQEAVQRSLEAGSIPAPLRDLASFAALLGMGDDVCRTEAIARLSEAQREEIRRAVGAAAPRIHAWLDEFGEGAISEPAAAFMYLLLSVEEMASDGVDG